MLDLGMLSRCSKAFDALSDQQSLRIVDLLFQGNKTIGALAGSLSLSEGVVGEKLSTLEGAGLVVRGGKEKKPVFSLHPALFKTDAQVNRIDLGSCVVEIRVQVESTVSGRFKRMLKSTAASDPEFLAKCASVFRIFSNMNRIAIISLLTKGHEIDDQALRTLPIDEADIARHVSILEKAGVMLVGKRDGLATYRIAESVFRKEKFIDLIDFGFCTVGFRFRHLDDSKMELGVV